MQALSILGHGDDQVTWCHFLWENKASGCTVGKRQAGNGSTELWECSAENPLVLQTTNTATSNPYSLKAKQQKKLLGMT